MDRVRLLVFVGGLGLMACGSSETTSTPAIDAGSDAATDALGDADTGPRYRSFLMLERWARLDPKADNAMTGLVTFHADGAMPRATTIDERCVVHEGFWKETGTRPPSWGTVRMQGTDLGEVTFVADDEGMGYEAPGAIPVWNTGSKLRVIAAGADLPGFDVEDTVPAQAFLTKWDLLTVKANEISIRRDQPLVLTWTPVSTDVFFLVLQFDDAASKRFGFWCTWPGASGTATVPTSIIGKAIASTSVKATNLYFGGASRKRLALDRVDLDVVTWKGQCARVLVQ